MRTRATREFRAERRRRALVLAGSLSVTFWALADLVAARHRSLSDVGASFLEHLGDYVQPVAWTLALVVTPLLVSVKPRPRRAGAILALLTGPVLTPLVFGAGGWHLWQIGLLGAIALWIESEDQRRARFARSAEEEDSDVSLMAAEPASPSFVPESPSFQKTSGASLHSRSRP